MFFVRSNFFPLELVSEVMKPASNRLVVLILFLFISTGVWAQDCPGVRLEATLTGMSDRGRPLLSITILNSSKTSLPFIPNEKVSLNHSVAGIWAEGQIPVDSCLNDDSPVCVINICNFGKHTEPSYQILAPGASYSFETELLNCSLVPGKYRIRFFLRPDVTGLTGYSNWIEFTIPPRPQTLNAQL